MSSKAFESGNDVTIAITAASYSGNKGAAAMLQSSIKQLLERYGSGLNIKLMSVYPSKDLEQIPFDFIEVVPATPEKLVFLLFRFLFYIFYLDGACLSKNSSRRTRLSKPIHKRMSQLMKREYHS